MPDSDPIGDEIHNICRITEEHVIRLADQLKSEVRDSNAPFLLAIAYIATIMFRKAAGNPDEERFVLMNINNGLSTLGQPLRLVRHHDGRREPAYQSGRRLDG